MCSRAFLPYTAIKEKCESLVAELMVEKILTCEVHRIALRKCEGALGTLLMWIRLDLCRSGMGCLSRPDVRRRNLNLDCFSGIELLLYASPGGQHCRFNSSLSFVLSQITFPTKMVIKSFPSWADCPTGPGEGWRGVVGRPCLRSSPGMDTRWLLSSFPRPLGMFNL